MKKILKWTAIGLVIAIASGILGILGLMTWTYAEEIYTDIINKINSTTQTQTQTQTTTLTADTYYELGEYTLIDIDGAEAILYNLNITKDELDYLNKDYMLSIYDTDKTELYSYEIKYVTAGTISGVEMNGYVYQSMNAFIFYQCDYDAEINNFVESNKVSLCVVADLVGGVKNAGIIDGFEIKEIVAEEPDPEPNPDDNLFGPY